MEHGSKVFSPGCFFSSFSSVGCLRVLFCFSCPVPPGGGGGSLVVRESSSLLARSIQMSGRWKKAAERVVTKSTQKRKAKKAKRQPSPPRARVYDPGKQCAVITPVTRFQPSRGQPLGSTWYSEYLCLLSLWFVSSEVCPEMEVMRNSITSNEVKPV